jgi:threonine-phosphate decarboxylase
MTLDFCSSVNFLKPTIHFDIKNIDLNKKIDISKLENKLALKYKIQKENIEVFSSKNSALFSLYNVLPINYCTVYAPSLLTYKKACEIYTYDYDAINKNDNLNRAVEENSLVVFENPSCIDGKYTNIEDFLIAWTKLNCTILIDETLLDFTNYSSCLKHINNYENLYILKKLNSFYGSEAIQTSIILSCKKNIHKIKYKEAKNKISAFDIEFLSLCLNDHTFHKTTKAINIKNNELLSLVLQKSTYFTTVFSCDTNVILCKIKEEYISVVKEIFHKNKILFKECSAFEFLDTSHIRLTVQSEKIILKLEKLLTPKAKNEHTKIYN